MSSLVRRIQKRIAKGQGYRRYTRKYLNEVDPLTGLPVLDPLFGHIVDSNGDSVGLHWPKVSAPAKEVK